MRSVSSLKQHKRSLVHKHARPDNVLGLAQALTTLLPLAALWWIAWAAAGRSFWLAAAVIPVMTLFLVRAFVLMHECGHGSLFRSAALNRAFGFVFGVVSGMPQYVWSEHHHFHHSTNGNWAKYRGPLTVVTVDEYRALNTAQQRRYRQARSLWLAPLGGFLYLIANPRLNWLKGTAALLHHVVKQKFAQPQLSLREHAAGFRTAYWNSPQQYRHMCGNNLMVLGTWAAMSLALGPALFFTLYLISGSLAGGVGIVLFTVQHNFEHAYASGDENWCYDTAVLHGTSFLVLPAWLNWFTANIAYHHIHHLSARIPNYRLADCHEEYQHLFTEVSRVKLGGVGAALKFILWDARARRLVAAAE